MAEETNSDSMNKKGEAKPSASQTPPSSNSPNAFFSTSINFGFILLLAIANDLTDYLQGYQINLISLGLDVFTLFIFWMYGFRNGARLGLLLLTAALDFVIPSYFSRMALFPELTGILFILPVWVIFAIGSKYSFGIKSGFTDVVAFIAIAFGIFLLSPYFYTSPNDVVINQKWIQDAFGSIGEQTGAAIESGKIQFEMLKCNFVADSDACKNTLVKSNEEEFLINRLQIEEVPNSGFTMKFEGFTSEQETIIEDRIPIQIYANNNLNKQVALSFSCGLERYGPGTPKPETLNLQQGILPLQSSTVVCTELNISKRATTGFYFNATANSLTSSGDRTIYVVSKEYKDSVISRYPGIEENSILLKSKEFSSFLKEIQPLLKTRVAKDDLVQPLTLLGAIRTVEAKQVLLFGIENEIQIPFALFLKNNGNGRITKVNAVTFDLPNEGDLQFDIANCGLTDINKVSWRDVLPGKFLRVATCNVIVKSSQKYPNNPQPRTIGVKIDYDYTVSRSAEVNIRPQLAATPTPVST